MRIKIKYHADIEPLNHTPTIGNWIDLRSAVDVKMNSGEHGLIPLGVSMKFPDGYEGHLVPRSSTLKHFGVIQANHMGVIDESFCSDEDQWMFSAIATRDTKISKGDRICQFRIVPIMPQITFETVNELNAKERGGFGSTGKD